MEEQQAPDWQRHQAPDWQKQQAATPGKGAFAGKFQQATALPAKGKGDVKAACGKGDSSYQGGKGDGKSTAAIIAQPAILQPGKGAATLLGKGGKTPEAATLLGKGGKTPEALITHMKGGKTAEAVATAKPGFPTHPKMVAVNPKMAAVHPKYGGKGVLGKGAVKPAPIVAQSFGPRKRITKRKTTGVVLDWTDRGFGWVRSHEAIEDEASKKQQGRIYVTAADLIGAKMGAKMEKLGKGRLVMFHASSASAGNSMNVGLCADECEYF